MRGYLGAVKLHFIIAFLLLVGHSQATMLTVCPSGCDYSYIQDAINVADNGDVIEVQSGSYPDTILIDKDILLIGKDMGNGPPSVGIIYRGKTNGSAISGIRTMMSFAGYPSPNIVTEDIWLDGRPVNTTIRNYGSVSVIGPTLDNSTRFSGNPSYTLETQVTNGPVNQGDDINVSFFMPGAGNIESCVLRISIPPYLIKEKRFTWRYPVINSQGKESYEKDEINRTTLEMDISYIFGKGPYPSRANIGSFGVLNKDTSYPPFNIDFRIADDAPAGDHNIYISLLYKNKDQWQMEKQSIPIHVRYWYESKWLQVLVWIALFLGTLASLGSLGVLKFINDWIFDP
jgi:hypothetical protein